MRPATRRGYLRGLGVTFAAGVGGCLGVPGPGDGTSGAGTSATHPTVPGEIGLTPAGPDRARGEPVSVERQVTDEPGYDDGIEYFPANRTVRFVATRSGDEPVSFGTWTFEEWGRIETAEVGVERARQAASTRLGTSELGSSIGVPPDFAATDAIVIWLELTVNRDREGNVTNTPTVPYRALVEAAPRSVDATVAIEGDRFDRSVPVFVRKSVLQLL